MAAPTRDAQFEAEALSRLDDVARFARSLTRDEADADDLVQETFLRAYRSWDSYMPGTDCRRWLFTICRNAFLRTRERERRMIPVEDPELETLGAVVLAVAADRSGHGDMFTSMDLAPAIRRALDELPEAFRQAVELVDVNDFSYEDAASLLGVPIGTIRSRLFRGRRLLQQSLMDHARDAGLTNAGRDEPLEELH
jgi:RNA polymerase sigma-70 factor (ECF subfamily)